MDRTEIQPTSAQRKAASAHAYQQKPAQQQAPSPVYAPEEVSKTAELIWMPDLPPPKPDSLAKGNIRLRVFIDEKGKAVSTALENSESSGYVQTVADSFLKAIYKPAILDDRPVSSWLILDFSYGE